MKALVPDSGPMLCRDEMEDWSASEANLFEEAIDKYGKDFNDIRYTYITHRDGLLRLDLFQQGSFYEFK